VRDSTLAKMAAMGVSVTSLAACPLYAQVSAAARAAAEAAATSRVAAPRTVAAPPVRPSVEVPVQGGPPVSLTGTPSVHDSITPGSPHPMIGPVPRATRSIAGDFQISPVVSRGAQFGKPSDPIIRIDGVAVLIGSVTFRNATVVGRLSAINKLIDRDGLVRFPRLPIIDDTARRGIQTLSGSQVPLRANDEVLVYVQNPAGFASAARKYAMATDAPVGGRGGGRWPPNPPGQYPVSALPSLGLEKCESGCCIEGEVCFDFRKFTGSMKIKCGDISVIVTSSGAIKIAAGIVSLTVKK